VRRRKRKRPPRPRNPHAPVARKLGLRVRPSAKLYKRRSKHRTSTR